jgi:hypothetical protein
MLDSNLDGAKSQGWLDIGLRPHFLRIYSNNWGA